MFDPLSRHMWGKIEGKLTEGTHKLNLVTMFPICPFFPPAVFALYDSHPCLFHGWPLHAQFACRHGQVSLCVLCRTWGEIQIRTSPPPTRCCSSNEVVMFNMSAIAQSFKRIWTYPYSMMIGRDFNKVINTITINDLFYKWNTSLFVYKNHIIDIPTPAKQCQFVSVHCWAEHC